MKRPSFSILLKQYRMAAGFSQEALAERANISARAISNLERGTNQSPRADTLNAIVQALSLSEEQRRLLLTSARPTIPDISLPTDPLYILPATATKLIGREHELARARILSQSTRLLTFTGPAGVGKTRLVLDLAQKLGADFKDGVVFVSLASLADPDLVASLIARTCKVGEVAGIPLSEHLFTSLSKRHLLLLLDNFEQVIDAASFVAELMQECPHLHLLITSRIPLHLRGEQRFPLGPLAPQAAITLFQQRAQAIEPDQPYDPTLIAAICSRLDHLPLAIELAAAQVKVLSLPHMLERLSPRLPLLQHGTRDMPKRQRTMRAAIAWSYDLLEPTAQQLFCLASIYEGGCTEDALASVCAGTVLSSDLLPALATLVDASLFQSQMQADGPMRFYLLELIREYAQEQLKASGQEELYRERHATYYMQLLETAVKQDFREGLVEPEMPNIRAALHWFSQHNKAERGLHLAVLCEVYWMKLGQMSEGYFWLERMLDLDNLVPQADKAPISMRIAALYAAGGFARNLGEVERAEALARESWLLAERADDFDGVSNALALLGQLAQARGDLGEATHYFEQSYQSAQKAQHRHVLGRALINLAFIARVQGNFARATEILEGQLQPARSAKFTWGIANCLTLLGHIAREQHHYDLARSRYRESLPLYHALGNLTYTALCLEGIAALACAEANYEQAIRFCAHAALLRLKAGTPLPHNEQQAFENILATASTAFDETCFRQHWQQGIALSDDEGIALALSYLG